MPELPEVETVVRGLRPLLSGRVIVAVEAGRKRLRRRWRRSWEPLLRRRRIAEVRRRGKWIILDLSQRQCLLIHLGMTGQLRVVPADLPREDHTHVVFRLAPGHEELRFRDVRRFGCVNVLDFDKLAPFFAESRLGPEPFALTSAEMFDRLQKTERCLKAILLDQQVVAGVGNIYADESLFEAKLHPTSLGCELTWAEADRLRRAVVTVLKRAIRKGGTTIRDYLNGQGERGGYQREFRVYQRTGEPCLRCETPIAQIRLAGRSTHFCPVCQRGRSRLSRRVR